MTDSMNSASESDPLESLVAQYEAAVSNLDTGDTTALLNTRSDIEARWSDLNSAQVQRVEDADTYIVQNSGQVASRLAASGTSLRELRAATPRPSEQWWWYLDVVSHVSNELTASTPASSSSLFSKIITGVELVVLAIAIFLLARNFIPQLQGGAAAPAANSGSSATAFPSWTPAPTGTIDAAAFDLSAATTYKSPDNVIELKLPKGWKAVPPQQPGRIAYSFNYGEEASPTMLLQVFIEDPALLYSSFLGLTTNPKTPQEALEALKKNSAGNQFVFGDVTPGKIGTLDASTLTISIPASQQGGPATEFELRIAPLEGGKIAFVGLQSGKDVWDKAKPVLTQMADSLVLTPGNIPTATPTLTPHPLELTATAIQNLAATNMAQIQALTPTATPAATQAATGDAAAGAASATGDAAGAATSAAPDAAATATPAS